MKVTVFIGDEEVKEEDFKNYICVSPYVSRVVNEVYYDYKRKFEERKKKRFYDNVRKESNEGQKQSHIV